MCEIKASQIFKRNKNSELNVKKNVIQMVKDVFEDTAAARAEREDTARSIASARAQTEEAGEEDDEDAAPTLR